MTPFYLRLKFYACKSGLDPNKNVIVSKYSLLFSTSMEGSGQKKLLQDKVALETSMEGLPNMPIELGNLCNGLMLISNVNHD